ncbi:hypothetical protein ACMA5I_13435 [Paracoccaceae bacterium GXU_MW_L88]
MTRRCALMFSVLPLALFAQDSPFGLGENTGPPASCDTIEGWSNEAPQDQGRISLALRGVIDGIDSDDALVYLHMCEDTLPATCITYHPIEYEIGTEVVFAGGYHLMEADPPRIILDPCLPFPADEAR